MNQQQQQKLTSIKKLISALAFSGFLNIVLLTALIYSFIRETPQIPRFEKKPLIEQKALALSVDLSNSDIIRRYRQLSCHQLIHELQDTSLIENGYTKRDLALACLESFHHFDLQRALKAIDDVHKQSRIIAYGKRKNGSLATLTVYPQLEDKHFQALINFAKTEKWPYSPKGLFTLLQRKENEDTSLVNAFLLTEEFISFETLMSKSETAIDKNELLSMLLQGDFQMLADFSQQQHQTQDLSAECRQKVLVDYIEKGSISAANLLLKVDLNFAIRKLDNNHILKMLQLLTEKNDSNEAFALALLKSPRSDAVWKMAAERLYAYAGEALPKNLQQNTAIVRFLPQQENLSVLKGMEKPQIIPKQNKQIPIAAKEFQVLKNGSSVHKKDCLYIVQNGDNLWKLSRRFNVDINVIRQHNQLKSDALKPGLPLRIPYN